MPTHDNETQPNIALLDRMLETIHVEPWAPKVAPRTSRTPLASLGLRTRSLFCTGMGVVAQQFDAALLSTFVDQLNEEAAFLFKGKVVTRRPLFQLPAGMGLSPASLFAGTEGPFDPFEFKVAEVCFEDFACVIEHKPLVPLTVHLTFKRRPTDEDAYGSIHFPVEQSA